MPVLVIGGATLTSMRADACGPFAPSADYTIITVTPVSETTGVARDTGIVINSTSCSGWPAVSGVTLLDVDTGEAQPVLVISWSSALPGHEPLAFHPVQPLAPQHRYQIQAMHRNSPGAPDEEDEDVDVSTFTTSDALLEPLALSGELELSFHGINVYSQPVDDCFDIGTSPGCYTPPMYLGRALVADVMMPPPSGGQGLYDGMLYLSDRTPVRVSDTDPAHGDYDDSHEVRDALILNPAPGEAFEISRQLQSESFAYAPCFAFVVWDPAGHVAQTSACLPSLSPEDVQTLASRDGNLSLSNDQDVAFEQLRQALGHAPDSGASSSCSFGPRQSTTLPGWLALLFASFGLRRRPRRGKRART